MRVAGISSQEGLQVGFQIRDCERKVHGVRLGRNSEGKTLPPNCFCPEPRPVSAIIDTYGRTPHPNGITGRKAKFQSAAGGSPDAEVPVEPVHGGVAQFLMQGNQITIHRIDNNIAARKITINNRISPTHGYSSGVTRSHRTETTKAFGSVDSAGTIRGYRSG